MCVTRLPEGAESLSGSACSEVYRVDTGVIVPGSEGVQVGPEAKRRSLGIADRGQPGLRSGGRNQGFEHGAIREAGFSSSVRLRQKKCYCAALGIWAACAPVGSGPLLMAQALMWPRSL